VCKADNEEIVMEWPIIIALVVVVIALCMRGANKQMKDEFEEFKEYVHYIETQLDFSPYSVLAIETYTAMNKNDILAMFYKTSKQDPAYNIRMHALFVVRNVLKRAYNSSGALDPEEEEKVYLDYVKAQETMKLVVSKAS
jgi:hypothetical protein